MKTLEVTDEQYAYIQRLREAIAAEVVGEYGFVRERDAVQYLIDNVDGDVEVEGDVTSSAIEDVSRAADAAIAGEHDEAAADEAASAASEAAATDDGDVSDDGADAATADEADEADGEDAEAGTADDDDKLNAMMNLLETHEDKWEESPSGDHRYRVTLPDGATEDVQTKDDVRAILFKNY